MWNLSAECISGVIVTIILIYSYRGNPLPSLRNRIFNLCLVTTFCSIFFNILSTIMLAEIQIFPTWATYLVTLIYFLFTPTMGLTYFCYTAATALEGKKYLMPVLGVSFLPFVVYILSVLFNHVTNDLFFLDPVLGYVRGERIGLTYLIFYFYCVACLVLSIVRWTKMDKTIRVILFTFPAIALGVVLVQAMFPTYILSGSAATCALLIIYLYVQNKRIAIDSLTGLATRQEFLALLELCERRNEPFTAVVVSLNGFKLINDKFGVAKGDLFLKGICKFLQELARGERLYRYNGDQFIIHVRKHREKRTEELVEQIVQRMCSPWSTGEYSYVLSAAVGIVEAPEVAQSSADFVSGLEAVVAFSKQTKEPCRCTPEMLEEVRRQRRIIQLMRRQLEQNSFTVYYQPIWCGMENRFKLAEALLRMDAETELGYISPMEFIPLAEDTGLIIDITYQLLEKVCGFIRDLMEREILLDAVAVNFSVVQFLQENLAERVLEIIERNGVPYQKIKIEITESVVITNTEVVRTFMEKLGAKGIRFGLDDFGTGQSNVAAFLQMPFDTIKLDKSIIYMAMKDPKAAGFMWNLTRAFTAMGRSVVAEGVETPEQRDYVNSCGCDLIQGFLYARPCIAEEAEQTILSGAPDAARRTPGGSLS